MNNSRIDTRVQKAEDIKRYVKYPITAILEAIYAGVLVSIRRVPLGDDPYKRFSGFLAQVGGSGGSRLAL